jgi:hypothetical protein
MQQPVPEEVLKKTVKCPKGFSCLSIGHGACEVCGKAGDEELFVNKRNSDCPYRIFYGEKYICTCPTHYYLYKNREK